MLTGCAAVAENGIRFGRSYQYFDIEWGLMAELGLVSERTPVAVIVHDVQLVPARLAPMPGEAVPDMIATPGRLVRVTDRPRRPAHVLWDRIEPEEIEVIPALVELERARGLRR
jgi:5-formyltetrahydrofolate cyclo-ligase